jgi:hypothetical protein
MMIDGSEEDELDDKTVNEIEKLILCERGKNYFSFLELD